MKQAFSIRALSTWVPLSSSEKPPATAIAPAQRRRMSACTKSALCTALTCGDEDIQPDYAVFTTRHGEIQRTYSLLGNILDDLDLSPSFFSQSVHNTAAGLYSILLKNQIPSTTISAGTSSFTSGLLEAVTYLSTNPQHRVLLTHFDEVLPDDYRAFTQGKNSAHALSLVLEADTGTAKNALSLEYCATQKVPPTDIPEALRFISWFEGSHKSLNLSKVCLLK